MQQIRQADDGKITALYERLSKDDDFEGDSNSIVHQKEILETYAKKNGFSNIRHFVDDGVSGTLFKRPGLDALLDEVRAGRVATVIIKDQSRIGRDVLEVGLLKRTFDEFNVRLIAANDNLDTANGFDIRLPASATDKVFSANLEGVLQGIRFMGIRCHTGWEREIPGFNCVVPVVNANDHSLKSFLAFAFNSEFFLSTPSHLIWPDSYWGPGGSCSTPGTEAEPLPTCRLHPKW